MLGMMKNHTRSIVIWGMFLATVGCESEKATPPADDNSTAAAQQTPAAPTNTSPLAESPSDSSDGTIHVERYDDPKKTVREFLTVLRAGNQQRATALLTVRAQQEMARHDAAIQPPGSPTATFEISQIAYVGQDQQGAHVTSIWHDSDSDGATETHEIVWILRREASGWAIAGFATKVFPDQPMLVLNFEDPRDLQAKRAAVDDEIARRQTPAFPEQAILE